MRSFVALELPGAVVRGLQDVCAQVRGLAPGWAREKWVAPEALHVTLKFLGDLDAEELDLLAARLGERLSSLEPVAYSLDGLRAVPSPRCASMLWAVPAAESPAMAELAAQVDEAAVSLGVPAEERRFATHVTLARARRGRHVSAETLERAWACGLDGGGLADGRKDTGKPSFGILSGSDVTVFTSTLTRSGPVYEIRARVPLGRAC